MSAGLNVSTIASRASLSWIQFGSGSTACKAVLDPVDLVSSPALDFLVLNWSAKYRDLDRRSTLSQLRKLISFINLMKISRLLSYGGRTEQVMFEAMRVNRSLEFPAFRGICAVAPGSVRGIEVPKKQ
ncbi:hypothetical protein MTO96_036103 [Rhipicephalus appendiculatus]